MFGFIFCSLFSRRRSKNTCLRTENENKFLVLKTSPSLPLSPPAPPKRRNRALSLSFQISFSTHNFRFSPHQWNKIFKIIPIKQTKNGIQLNPTKPRRFFFFFWWHRRTSLKLVTRRRAYCTTILTVNQTPTGNWPHPPEPVTGNSQNN